jgi:uncharacterized membrane protein YeaQ/YmgE (transglycosylase-associated protein family)
MMEFEPIIQVADGEGSTVNFIADTDPDSALSGLVDSGLLSWLILGLIAGTIAKVILPGRDPGGLFGTILIGIAGAFIGGWLSSTFLDRSVDRDFVDPALWVSAIAGSLVLLIGYRIFFGHSRERRR